MVVYQDGAKLCKWDAIEAKRIRTKVLTNAEEARWYAQSVVKARFELVEPAIATNALESRTYAEYVLEGPFKLGEKAITTDPVELDEYNLFLDSLK